MASEARTAEVLDGFFELLFAALHAEDHGQGGGQKIAPAYAAQFLEAPVGDDGMAQLERVAILGRLVEDISFRADIGIQRHHQAFADRVDGRIGDLREGLLEIAEQQLRLIGKARQGRIDAHGADRLLGLGRRRREHRLQILIGVAEGALAHEDGFVVGGLDALRAGQIVQRDLIFLQPLPVRLPRR